ncbi:MAG TPA: prephenate dehydratase [Actinomycetales bacterium]|nr:prephenate dehydratase [Actinomycetales bacterium]
MTTYAYLGPQGTFTEAALRQVVDVSSADHVAQPMATVDAALAAVRAGEADAAMVPIENSVEGGVAATLDALANGSPLRVVREVLVPITFVLAARPGTRLEDVRRVSSHPHGWAQCRGWVAEHLPDARYLPALSTAGAAEGLAPAAGDEATEAPYDAALCAPLAAERFGLEVLADDVGDRSAAVTRFVLVSRPGPLGEPSGNDKTTVVVYQRDDDRPGGLLELLEQFATRGVNLSRIESRPTGDALGQYFFSIDCEGHVREARVAEALMGLHRTCSEVRFLGSYPRADAGATIVSAATSDTAFSEARTWLTQLDR